MKFPGAAYIDIDANGVAHIAPPGFPGDGLCRALRCSRSGQRIAGFDQSDNVYEWVFADRAWQPRGKSFGGRAVIYRGEELLVRRDWPPVGFRYVRPDGTIVTAEETGADLERRVWEYTVLPNGWIVGQGGAGATYVNERGEQAGAGEDPLIILPGDGTRRLVRAGMCRFINAYLVGDRIDLAWQEPGGCDALSLTTADVLRLPIVAATHNDVVPTHNDVPAHTDTPPEKPTMPDSLEAEVRAERAKYPAVLTEDQPAKILNAVAWKHRALGWGLSVKKAGNRVPSPQGVDVAYDILHHKPTDTLWGCFTDELRATVNWGQEAHHHNPDRPWLAPIAPAVEPAHVDAPSHVDTPPAVDPLAKRVEQLELIVKQLNGDVASLKEERLVDDLIAEGLLSRVADLERKLEEVKRTPAPLPRLRVRGSTSRSFGHGHKIDLPVEEDK